MFPLISLQLLASDLHKDKTLGGLRSWESYGFPVITQPKSSKDKSKLWAYWVHRLSNMHTQHWCYLLFLGKMMATFLYVIKKPLNQFHSSALWKHFLSLNSSREESPPRIWRYRLWIHLNQTDWADTRWHWCRNFTGSFISQRIINAAFVTFKYIFLVFTDKSMFGTP